MVYRYESDEDAYVEYPGSGSDRSVLGAGPPPPAGPSPSRFPTPSLPRATRVALPPADEPAPPRDPVPPRDLVPPGEPPRTAAYAAPPPVESFAEPYSPPPPVELSPATTSAAPPAESPRAERYSPPPTESPGGYATAGPAEPLPPRRGGGRMWQVLIGGAAVLVLLALCGLGAAALLMDRTGNPTTSEPTTQPGVAQSAAPEADYLDSRDTDQAPLTGKEVFPGKQLTVTDGQPAYQVLKTQSSASCAVAATDEVADLLVRLGCSQVVRATLRTPDRDHLVTAGLFNLTDRASAERARDRIRQLLDERQGRFRGMAADAGTEAMATAPARVGWQVRGHYLAYAVVARADGETIRSGDTAVREILFDLIELHLNQGVLERRADGGVAGQPTAGRTDDGTGADNGRPEEDEGSGN
ncbi:hypothetical protein [Micromonospora echinaurantiaca]|uniref:hypothetical protein n=1 Tax=Micromonospora echinaurantiaca TaxID=47857 RepID=UPI003443D9FF